MRRNVLIGMLLMFAVAWPVSAADHYVRAGATGTGDGSDWTNAYTALPATLTRGDTYWVADGEYGAYTFNDAADGTSVITIKKATTASHGTDTGWSASYGDGQAVWTGRLHFVTDYYVFDGATRNEADWQDQDSYGFRRSFTGASTYGIDARSNDGDDADYITIRYVDIGADEDSAMPCGGGEAGVYIVFAGQSNWTLSRVHIHDVRIPIQTVGAEALTLEYSHIGPSYSKEAISHQIGSNWVIRHNRFVDNLIYPTGCEGTGSGGTADIWARDESESVTIDAWSIYGNVFADTGDFLVYRNNAIILGDCWNSRAVTNWKVYNNTFYNLGGQQGIVRICGSTDNVVANLLWYKLREALSLYPDTATRVGVTSGPTASHLWCYEDSAFAVSESAGCDDLPATGRVLGSENPFVDASRLDFRLKGTFVGNSPVDAGTTLGVGFDAVDGRGRTRGDGSTAWDIGAFERLTPPPNPPTNVRD